MKFTKEIIASLEQLSKEPMFGGQLDRINKVLYTLKIVHANGEYWRDRFSIGHPNRSEFMDLSITERKELYDFFVMLVGKQDG